MVIPRFLLENKGTTSLEPRRLAFHAPEKKLYIYKFALGLVPTSYVGAE